MDVINYSNDRFKNFTKLSLINTVHTESELYFVEYYNKLKIFKRLYLTEGEQFSNKMYTISSLIDNKNKINIDEIVFPEQIVTISKNIQGFIMPYIKNVGFKNYLNLKNKTIKDRIDCFKQVNEILLKMKDAREKNNLVFYIGDLHEDNLLYNVETKKINLVDIDSCSILKNHPFPSKYLSSSYLASYLPLKYKVNDDKSENVVPNQDSDIFCYAIMILNFLYKNDFYKLDIISARMYLEYLKQIGFSNDFIDNFSKPFYENVENTFLGNYIDEITEEKLEKSSYTNFKEYVLKKY